MVAAVMNRNVKLYSKGSLYRCMLPLSCHQILTRGSGSGTDQDLASQNNTDPVGFRFRSAILQKTQRVPLLSLSMFLLTFYKVLRYWYLPLCTLSRVVLLHCMTQRVPRVTDMSVFNVSKCIPTAF
jgi:hypothetical protein